LILKDERGLLVTSEVAAAEADYLILNRLGVELSFLDDLAEGTFLVECLTREEFHRPPCRRRVGRARVNLRARAPSRSGSRKEHVV
jgi:hypothetical protein